MSEINNKEKICQDLFDKKAVVRRKAALKIAKEKLVDCGDELFVAYLNEKENPIEKSWETQKNMLIALGMIRYEKAIPVLEANMQEVLSIGTTVISNSALAYVRILRRDLSDISPIMELYKTKNIDIIYGATYALPFDDMVPSNSDIARLISFFDTVDNYLKSEIKLGHGKMDPRFYLLAATINWNQQLPCIQQFIESCSSFLNPEWIEKVKKKKRIIYEF